jgi:hypothetical protein
MTRRYCDVIADELRVLEIVLDGPNADDEGNYVAALAKLELSEDFDQSDAFAWYLNEVVLEATVYDGNDDFDADDFAGDPGRYRVVLLRTCGGPRCEVEHGHDDGDYLLVTSWEDGTRESVSVFLPTLSSMLACYATETLLARASR